MEKEIILPNILIESGFSLDTHCFRYRPDHDFFVSQNGMETKKNKIIEEIEKRSLWHSSVGSLNDPFEVYAKKNDNEFNLMGKKERLSLFVKMFPDNFKPNSLETEYDKVEFIYKCTETMTTKAIDNLLKVDIKFDDAINELRGMVGISCFTSICDSRLMWGYYCNGLSGVCLIYNKKKLKDNGIELHQVKYIEDAHSIDVLDFTYNCDSNSKIKILSKIPEYKHKDWAHENEHRSIVYLNDEHVNKGGIVEMKNPCIDGVIVGSNVTNHVQKIIRKKEKEFKFKLFKAEVDYSSFSVKVSS
ncbi:DUF2971 domain-containing protein [Pectobacterium aroidearum]|uniref:DUF2971 domain-containing protein n=1 Tax=Pectobacterium aroidearum TaxID=1201031 RepID=UPI0015F0D58A|nr:DUF2971 domain-containing protein [Pectobacterium aroidearum]MBA5238346.1 DUF2971 domain-containing protein [Pectobacterium aroidearum]